MLRHLLLVPVLIAATSACKSRGECTADPVGVQFLAVSHPVLNTDDAGKSWPTNLRIYELKKDIDLEQLEFDTVLHESDKAFGDALVKSHEQVIYPDRRKPWQLVLDPSTRHVVTVGLFREPIADAWYQAYTLPADHAAQRCEAKRRGKTPADPCVFLAFERNEVSGGRFPPAGFDVKAFSATCAPVIAAPSKQPKKNKKRRSWRIPELPQTPRAPQTPQAPQAPQAPQGPQMPQAPRGPTAPQAPRLPGR
ncbi:MAG TPA: type VI secretion system lipoprotein TssJ [Nannocystis sp.]